MKKLNKSEIKSLQKKAHQLIPAGAHTYSKADEQFSKNAPPFIQKSNAAYFWDLSGKKYVDYGMGIFAVSLGHAYPAITKQIKKQLKNGNSYSRPSILEGELAERLCNLIPCAEMAKFAKNGSDVTSAAIRLARAYTEKEYVVRCSQQPFHSFNDWFIGSTSRPDGIPKTQRELTLRFDYNDIESLKLLFDKYPNQIACVIMEPVTFDKPRQNFLQEVKSICHQNSSLLIFDEIITGFRWHLQGAQKFFDVTPDLATFGKGMSNGFATAALVGKRDIMKQGDFNGPVFLLSCTYGAELIGLTAAINTIKTFQKYPVVEHFWEFGKKMTTHVKKLTDAYKLHNRIKIVGYSCRPELLFFDENNNYSFELKTLFVQEMIKKGILMERIAISFSHKTKELKKTKTALEHTFKKIYEVLEKGNIQSEISEHSIKPVFTY